MNKLKVAFGSIIYVFGFFYTFGIISAFKDIIVLTKSRSMVLLITVIVCAILMGIIHAFIFFSWGNKFIRAGRKKYSRTSPFMMKIKRVVGYFAYLLGGFYLLALFGIISNSVRQPNSLVSSSFLSELIGFMLIVLLIIGFFKTGRTWTKTKKDTVKVDDIGKA